MAHRAGVKSLNNINNSNFVSSKHRMSASSQVSFSEKSQKFTGQGKDNVVWDPRKSKFGKIMRFTSEQSPNLSPVHKLEKKTPENADYEPENLPEASTQREHAAADVPAQDLSRDSSSDAL